MCLWLTDFVRS